MERFARRENVLLGCNSQKPFDITGSAERISDFDFNDVFGGPPRRFSMQETRNNLSEGEDSEDNPWSELRQNRVFGEENLSRRRYPSDYFFEDIFRGDESYSSPRRTDRVSFGSSPGSRVLSPSRPLPPKAEPFVTSPPLFSLPAKLTGPADFPISASGTFSTSRKKDSNSNGVNHASLSRFSSEALVKDDLKHYSQLSNSQSPSSREFSPNIEESSVSIFNHADTQGQLSKDPRSVDAPYNNDQFHFSIYKWAGRGLPMLIPLLRGSFSKLKEKGRTERCSSFKTQPEMADSILLNCVMSQKKTQYSLEAYEVVDESIPDAPEDVQSAVENGQAGVIRCNKRDESINQSLPEYERSFSTKIQDTYKPALKPLCSLIDNDIDVQGSEETRNASPAESMIKKAEMIHLDAEHNINKKHSTKEANSAISQSPRGHPGENPSRNRVKGKVKEFVKLFNQETSSKIDVDAQTHSSRWRSTIAFKAENGPIIGSARISPKDHLIKLNKIHDSSTLEDETLEKLKNVKENSDTPPPFHIASHRSFDQKDAVPIPESLPNGFEATFEDIDESFQDSILIEELFHDEEKTLKTSDEFEDFQDIDAKIKQWSNGKQGNVRSLLSTLQFILWPGSGWNPVALVDIIEGAAVKRTYQKALLCLHPDKLQQKGASSHQKYTAEKVFDILQEAWDHFNSIGSL